MSTVIRKKRLFYGNQFTKKNNVSPTNVDKEISGRVSPTQSEEIVIETLKSKFRIISACVWIWMYDFYGDQISEIKCILYTRI